MQIGALANRNLVTVGPGHSLADAARRMSEARVGSAVVNSEVPGIITERDLLYAMAAGADFATTPVSDYATANAITGSESWDVLKAARCMQEGGFRHLIVLDEQGGVSGMLSLRDLVETLLDQLEGKQSHAAAR